MGHHNTSSYICRPNDCQGKSHGPTHNKVKAVGLVPCNHHLLHSLNNFLNAPSICSTTSFLFVAKPNVKKSVPINFKEKGHDDRSTNN